MNLSPERQALLWCLEVCRTHREALRGALLDLKERRIGLTDLAEPGKADRRLLDQFAYRYTRLQDDMGAKLIPGILGVLGEEVSAMPALDRQARMEQLGWLESAEEWGQLRRIRNEFAHDYPEDAEERLARLAMAAGERLLEILEGLMARLRERGILPV